MCTQKGANVSKAEERFAFQKKYLDKSKKKRQVVKKR